MALGFGLAAFYILPAAFEQRWVQITQVVEEIFTSIKTFCSRIRTIRICAVQLESFERGSRHDSHGRSLGRFQRAATPRVPRDLVDARGARVLPRPSVMFPASIWLWRYLPKLQFLQFPWRWLAPLGIPYAFFLASAISQWRWRWVGYCGLAIAIAGAATAIVRDAWWDSEDIPILAAAIRTGHGYEGTDEYAPLVATATIYPVRYPIRTRPRFSLGSRPRLRSSGSILRRTPSSRLVTVTRKFPSAGGMPKLKTFALNPRRA